MVSTLPTTPENHHKRKAASHITLTTPPSKHERKAIDIHPPLLVGIRRAGSMIHQVV